MRRALVVVLVGALPAMTLATTRADDAPDAARREGLDLFERRVRPVLAERCVRCHGARTDGKPAKAGLRLDTAAGLRAGGESGVAVVPFEPGSSPLLARLRTEDDDERMPPSPADALTPDEVQDIEAWIRLGAPDPRGDLAAHPAHVTSAAPDDPRWALRPLVKPALPAVKDEAWCRDPLDRFVLARLEASGLRPAPEADRRTLLRRVTLDLTGLPPASDELAAFLADAEPGAYERVVDRLLATPAHAERWARHWLDVARHADTKGYVFVEDRGYPGAWTYRDWVVRALAADLPWDAFVARQLAADILVAKGELPKGELAALGFLTLGRRFLNDAWDITDDRIDVTTRGLLGLTVSCARCHDHRFDPIPQRDYYALAGVFRSAREPSPPPVIEDGEGPEGDGYRAERSRREAELAQVAAESEAGLRGRERAPARVAAYLVATRDARGLDDTAAAALGRERGLEPALLARWRAWLSAPPATPAVAAAARLASQDDAALARDPDALVTELAALTSATSPALASALLAARDAGALPADLAGAAALVAPALADPAILDAPGAPLALAPPELENLLPNAERERVQALRRGLGELEARHPGAPARAHALEDGPAFVAPLLRRGQRDQPGEAVPRAWLSCLSPGGVAPVWTESTGRLELAGEIVASPLSARAIVNRVWGWRWGEAIARTPSDLGARGERPTHPELLEWLAATFVEDGGSLRRLHRRLVTSATYRQASTPDAAARAADPDDRLLGWFPRRRLSAEEVRDGLLAAAGALDRAIGGRPVDLEASSRRTLYAFVDRQDPPTFLRTFDAPSPDAHAPRRVSTTVPQQALWLLNSPFVLAQATAIARAVDDRPAGPERVQALWARVLGREATADEVVAALALVASGPTTPARATAWRYGRGRFDPESARVVAFEPLPHFTGGAWQGGPALPDPTLGWCVLTAEGGHPGNDQDHAVIRRIVLPASGTLTLRGELVHPAPEGDGVRARVVSDRQGVLALAQVHHGSSGVELVDVAVAEGEVLDLVVDCITNEGWDSFSFAPRLTLAPASGAAHRVFSGADFTGPSAPSVPLDPWARLAHALVLTSEWLHVD